MIKATGANEPGWVYWLCLDDTRCDCNACTWTKEVLTHRDAGGCTDYACHYCRAWEIWRAHPEWHEFPHDWRKYEDPFKRAIINAVTRSRADAQLAELREKLNRAR